MSVFPFRSPELTIFLWNDGTAHTFLAGKTVHRVDTITAKVNLQKRENRKVWGLWDGSGRKCLTHKHEGLSSDLQHHISWAWCGTIDICYPSAGPETGRSPELCGQHSGQLVSSGLREEDVEKKSMERAIEQYTHVQPMVNLWLFHISTCVHVPACTCAYTQACIHALYVSIYAEIKSGSIQPTKKINILNIPLFPYRHSFLLLSASLS